MSNKRYFWIVTHLRIFRRESERPAKCKTMKMGDGAGERTQSRTRFASLLRHSLRCFNFSLALLLFPSAWRWISVRSYYCGLHDGRRSQQYPQPDTSRAASQNHVLCRCHWLSFRAIKIHVCAILQPRRHNSIVIIGKSMGFTLKGKLIPVTN